MSAHICGHRHKGVHIQRTRSRTLKRCQGLLNATLFSKQKAELGHHRQLVVARGEAAVATADVDAAVAPSERLRAVVYGSGMCGLSAAQELSAHVDEVILLERDKQPCDDFRGIEDLPTVYERRKGVPQFSQLHVLLGRGLKELTRLFPGIQEDVVASGGTRLEVPKDMASYDSNYGYLMRSDEVELELVHGSRALLETVTRQHLSRTPNVTTRYGAPVAGLLFNQDKSRVTGVKLNNGEEITADLVVDASGRGSKVMEWLGGVGYPAPPVVNIDSGVTYNSRMLELTPEAREVLDCKAMFIRCGYPSSKMVVAFPSDGGSGLQVIFSGRGSDTPVATDEGWAQWAADLPTPLASQMLQTCKPVGNISVYKRTDNCRRYYERVPKFPASLVVMGDAMCMFNPTYGQGITVAMCEVAALGEALGAKLAQVATSSGSGSSSSSIAARRDAVAAAAESFRRDVGKIVDAPWVLATGQDAPFLPGFKQSAADRFMQSYVLALTAVMPYHAQVRHIYMEVMHMLRPPADFFRPIMLALVLPKMLAMAVAGLLQRISGGLRRTGEGDAPEGDSPRSATTSSS